MYRLLRNIYSILFIALIPFIYIKKIWRSRKNKGYRYGWMERFGFFKCRTKDSIWFHAASVGENIAISPLVKEFSKKYPNLDIIVTMMTPTGKAQAEKIYLNFNNVKCGYVPYDIGLFVLNFLNRVNPKILIIMETEIWPNILSLCKSKNIKTILTNARLSEKSERGYRKISWLTNKMLNDINWISCQTDEDKNRFIGLGFPCENIEAVGNIKYDLKSDSRLDDFVLGFKKHTKNREIWLAASIHKDEDDAILNAHIGILKAFPDSLLIIAPRHPEVFDEMFKNAIKNSLNVIRQSSGKMPDDKTNVYLADSIGDMMAFYQIADVAFVGGSLIDRGGHNYLEPAFFKKAILSGPSFFNFKKIASDLIGATGIIIVNDSVELSKMVIDLFSDHDKRTLIGESAYKIVELNQGSLQKQQYYIESLHAKTLDKK